MKRCQYADGVPVLIEGKRIETITEDRLRTYARHRSGGYWAGKDDLLKEEGAFMRKTTSMSFTVYPPCDITGESTAVEAKVDEGTKMVTAYFVCLNCKGSK
jgi:hypothetical protein